jgi:hypothetical protein
MLSRYRLATFVLAGGYIGIAAISSFYVSAPDRFGFSVYKYQQWCSVGLAAGLFLGVWVELALRIAERRKWRFSLREFLIATAIIAAFLVACGGLIKWANAPDRGIGDASIKIKIAGGGYVHRQVIQSH